MKNVILAVTLLFLTCCSKEKSIALEIQQDSAVITKTDPLGNVPEPVKQSRIKILQNLNSEIMQALKSKNYERFSEFIHPEKGVQFSMYAYVRPGTDKHFGRKEFTEYISTPTKFTWGEKDGSGDLLVISLKDYLETWVFKRDFTRSEFYLNEFKGTGNSLNNLQKTYPGLDFTENYIPGSEKYGGMDWNALRFVFEEFMGEYYLVAVVNDQWTI